MSTQIRSSRQETLNSDIHERSIKAAFSAGFTDEIPNFIEQLPEDGTHPREVLHIAYRATQEISQIPGVEDRADELKGIGTGAGRVMLKYLGSGIREVDISAFVQGLPLQVRSPIQHGVADAIRVTNAPNDSEGTGLELFAVTETAPSPVGADRVGASEIFADPAVAQSLAVGINEILDSPDQASEQLFSSEDQPDEIPEFDRNRAVMIREAIQAAETPTDLRELHRISSETGDPGLTDDCFRKAKDLINWNPKSLVNVESLAELRLLSGDPLIQSDLAILRDRQVVRLGQSLFIRGEFKHVIELVEKTVFLSTHEEFYRVFASIYTDSLSRT